MAAGVGYGRVYRPQPIPYQGSKRLLATRILGMVRGLRFKRVFEPFAGSAAVTVAAASVGIAEEYAVSDSLQPLAAIWAAIIAEPGSLADEYERIWLGQLADSAGHYEQVRAEFNSGGEPAKLLYLLARCVKNAPRFNQQGGFNQSADRRRRGMHPDKMRREIHAASKLLSGRTTARCLDFEDALSDAGPDDLVYMDPPYGGTTNGPHKRYHQGLQRERLVRALENLNSRGVPFLLSYDGRCGAKTYGPPLQDKLAARIELVAGRSSQSTLLGRDDITVESLYVSHQLASDTKSESVCKQLALLESQFSYSA